jgi:hypothetical protein
LDVRLNTIGLDFSDYEKECFLIYCYGDFSKYDEEKMHIYIDDLYKILAHNKMNGFFNQKSLKEVFALSVTYALQSSQMTDLTKRQCYRYAVKSNIYPEIMRLKLFVHKILGR